MWHETGDLRYLIHHRSRSCHQHPAQTDISTGLLPDDEKDGVFLRVDHFFYQVNHLEQILRGVKWIFKTFQRVSQNFQQILRGAKIFRINKGIRKSGYPDKNMTDSQSHGLEGDLGKVTPRLFKSGGQIQMIYATLLFLGTDRVLKKWNLWGLRISNQVHATCETPKISS